MQRHLSKCCGNDEIVLDVTLNNFLLVTDEGWRQYTGSIHREPMNGTYETKKVSCLYFCVHQKLKPDKYA